MTAYLCSGMTTTQHTQFCEFADIGVPTRNFRDKAVVTFATIVEVLKNESIQNARCEEKMASEKDGTEGITIMTDARHACRKNSHHTDHVALGHRLHQVIDLQNITKADDPCSQRHEVAGCKKMYAALDEGDIRVDNHVINKIVKLRESEHGKMTINTNERWHAAKPIDKGILKIGKGRKNLKGITWHPEIGDKAALVKNHMYWSMDNCDKDPSKFRNLIDTCVNHFQNKHDQCHESSSCHENGYVPNFIVMKDSQAVSILQKFLHSLTVYKNAEDYVMACDTYYVESFNNTCLIYLDKRIHYKNTMYNLRSGLSVLDWNEHVDRPFTSVYRKHDARHPRRQSGKKQYKEKTFKFVGEIWKTLLSVCQENGETDMPQELNTEELSDSESDIDIVN
jgi:hypothetical protein